MWKDEIVEEVRQAREAHAKKFSYDLRKIVDDLQRQERERQIAIDNNPKSGAQLPAQEKDP